MILFSGEKRIVQPLELALNLVATIEEPPVHVLTIVVVQTNDAESWSVKHRVVAAKSDCGSCRRVYPTMSQPSVG